MKSLVIVMLAVLVTVQANRYLRSPHEGLHRRHGYDEAFGREYENQLYNKGKHGHEHGAYSEGGIHEGHDIGHSDSDYDVTVHKHTSSEHNIGGMSAEGHQGGVSSEFNDFANGEINKGDEYQRDEGYGEEMGI